MLEKGRMSKNVPSGGALDDWVNGILWSVVLAGMVPGDPGIPDPEGASFLFFSFLPCCWGQQPLWESKPSSLVRLVLCSFKKATAIFR